MEIRLQQHRADAAGERKTFAGRYNCIYVVHVEHFRQVKYAIAREKEIKGWSRAKKEALINNTNPNWEFLNEKW